MALPEITESLDELLQLLKTETNPRRKTRIHLLYLVKSGQAKTRKAAAKLLGIHRTTVGIWLLDYRQGGLSQMLTIETKPNHQSAIAFEVLDTLKQKLKSASGFASYKAIQQWLKTEHQLSLPYSTVHGVVRYKLKAKLKVGRKSHVKKNEKEAEAFKENLSNHLSESLPKTGDFPQIRVFAQDESRFGLILNSRRQITLPGIKPVIPSDHRFDNYYLYGVVEPTTGEAFLLELPTIETDCFQVFVVHLSQQFADSFNLLVLDQGAVHRADRLTLPDNVGFVFFPAYSPELNPIERLWEDIKTQIALEWFPTVDQMKQRVSEILKRYTQATIQSLTGYPFFVKAVHSFQSIL